MKAVVLSLAAFWLLWVLYLACMNLMTVRDAGKMPRVAYYVGLSVLGVGLLLNALVNVLLMTLILVELPGEMLVSQRVERHVAAGGGYRYRVCLWFRLNLLAPFDPTGKHG